MRTDKQAIQIYQQHLMHIGHINIVFKLGRMKIYLNIFNKHGKPIQSIMLFEDYGQLHAQRRHFPARVLMHIDRRNRYDGLVFIATNHLGERTDAQKCHRGEP